MKETLKICFLFLAFFLLVGCGSKDDAFEEPSFDDYVPQVQISTTVATPPVSSAYLYKGDRFRDPFIPLTGGGIIITNSDEVQVPNIGSLALKGILDDGRKKMAIITGGGMSYFLKDSKLYDNKSRLIKGITGAIKKESVLMIAPDKTTKELFLRQKE